MSRKPNASQKLHDLYSELTTKEKKLREVEIKVTKSELPATSRTEVQNEIQALRSRLRNMTENLIGGITEKLRKFLSTPRQSFQGCLASVTDQDIWDFMNIVNQIVEAKFAAASDESRPLDVILINLNRNRPLKYTAVPHPSWELYIDMEDQANHDKIVMEKLLSNLRTAASEMEEFLASKKEQLEDYQDQKYAI